MRRNGEAAVYVCHWCKRTLTGHQQNRTTPAYSAWPSLPAGVGVLVCGEGCPERPTGAPVGARLVWNGAATVSP